MDPILELTDFFTEPMWLHHSLPMLLLPALFLIGMVYFMVCGWRDHSTGDPKYRVRIPLRKGALTLNNIRRGVSIIGSAGSGKTESVVHPLMVHFQKHNFCGVIHDYKHFELTELAHPLFREGQLPFHIVSFDRIYKRVNPIAPRYLPDEESVNELSRVLLENLLEQKEERVQGSTKFFNDAVEGLIGAMIWMLRSHYPKYCTLPHLIAIYQYLEPEQLMTWLNRDHTARAMASAFISGRESERQTAAVLGSLSNALKKISTQRIFMALSADEVDLDINHPDHPSIISIVNQPRYEIAYSPIIATLIHTIIKQMTLRDRHHAFLLLEEAPTIRLLNMHRIPATLRSFNVTTVYVMQDKAQNDMMYGEKASKAILSNLSYQFFGKVNDPDTARYYERFFELVKMPTRSVSKSSGLSLERRITEGEKEVSKRRAEVFFRLKQGEFVVFADGKDRKVRFPRPEIPKGLPKPLEIKEGDLERHYLKVHREVRSIFDQQKEK